MKFQTIAHNLSVLLFLHFFFCELMRPWRFQVKKNTDFNYLRLCFSFQILPADRMSNRVCHACISFLNSWQSFKNRCYAAQKKQQTFLDLLLVKERAKQKTENDRHRQVPQLGKTTSSANDDQQRILKNALLNSTMRPNAVSNTSIDVVSIIFFLFSKQ